MTDDELFDIYQKGFEDGRKQAIKYVFDLIKKSELYKEMKTAELEEYVDKMAESNQYNGE